MQLAVKFSALVVKILFCNIKPRPLLAEGKIIIHFIRHCVRYIQNLNAYSIWIKAMNSKLILIGTSKYHKKGTDAGRPRRPKYEKCYSICRLCIASAAFSSQLCALSIFALRPFCARQLNVVFAQRLYDWELLIRTLIPIDCLLLANFATKICIITEFMKIFWEIIIDNSILNTTLIFIIIIIKCKKILFQ